MEMPKGILSSGDWPVSSGGFRMPPVVLVDIDGTVADMGKGQPGRRSPFDWDRVGEDEPIWPVINVVKALCRDWSAIFVSGRDEICRRETLLWLDKHGLTPYASTPLFMRPHKDYRSDVDVKREIYEREIRDRYDVRLVLDDRIQVVNLWRELGLTCFQVAEGNF